MPANADRAARIRALKAERPDLTWQAIADRCGVGLRAAQAWGARGQISYAHALVLAELAGRDADWIMLGDHRPESQLDRMEAKLDELLDRSLITQLADDSGLEHRQARDSAQASPVSPRKGSGRAPARSRPG